MLGSLSSTTTVTMTEALGNIFDIVPQCISVVTGNPILMTFFCAGVIGIAIGVIRKLKH